MWTSMFSSLLCLWSLKQHPESLARLSRPLWYMIKPNLGHLEYPNCRRVWSPLSSVPCHGAEEVYLSSRLFSYLRSTLWSTEWAVIHITDSMAIIIHDGAQWRIAHFHLLTSRFLIKDGTQGLAHFIELLLDKIPLPTTGPICAFV